MQSRLCDRCDGMGAVVEVKSGDLVTTAPAYPHTSPYARLPCAACEGKGRVWGDGHRNPNPTMSLWEQTEKILRDELGVERVCGKDFEGKPYEVDAAGLTRMLANSLFWCFKLEDGKWTYPAEEVKS